LPAPAPELPPELGADIEKLIGVGQALVPALAAAVLLALPEVTTTSAESVRPASSVTVNLSV
jgi:hypothetical protein